MNTPKPVAVMYSYEEAKKMNLTMAMEFKKEAWGQVHFMLRDPAGFRIDVVQHIEASEN